MRYNASWLASQMGNSRKVVGKQQIDLVRDMDEAIALTNEYAPEHLIIETRDYTEQAERIVNAGSVFLGSLTPESAGDYASGTNSYIYLPMVMPKRIVG